MIGTVPDGSAMDVCHPHNLNSESTAVKKFGIRVSLRPQDSFARLIGTNWERVHWFATAAERDRVLRDMAGEHRYSRRGDSPTLRFEPIES